MNITDPEDIERRVDSLSDGGSEFSCDELSTDNALYITENCLSSAHNNRNARYMLLDSHRTYKGYKIYVSLCRYNEHTDYSGGYVGTAAELINRTPLRRAPRINKERLIAKCKHTVSERETIGIDVDEIYNSLLVNHWSDVKAFSRYLKVLGLCVYRAEKLHDNRYFTQNIDGDVIISTGLLNKYANTIFLQYRRDASVIGGYVLDSVVTSAYDSKTLESLNVMPVLCKDDIVSNISENMFDISDSGLSHILNSHQDRVDNVMTNIPFDMRMPYLNACLKREIRMWARDCNYARTAFDTTLISITYYLPIHVNTTLNKAPELVALFKRNTTSGLYVLKTILPYDTIVQNRVLDTNPYTPWKWEE